MEYHESAYLMKPGEDTGDGGEENDAEITGGVGREEIAAEFKNSVQGTDRVEFFQDELEFFGDLTSAYQRAHMKGYVAGKEAHVFEGSYIIYWKKVAGEWLIHYDMFNSDQ